MTAIALEVEGTQYLDIEACRVTMGIEQFAREFSVEVSDKWREALGQPLPFKKGQSCKLSLDDEVVVDGFIDDVPVQYDGSGHQVTVVGRSNTGDMVDCSAIHQKGAWKQVTVDQIVRDLARPFGISVELGPGAVPGAPFRKFAIEDEETAFRCAMRACEARGLFLLSDAGNKITITGAGKVPMATALVEGIGGNIESLSRSGSYRERHSEYIVKSQNAGDDTWFGDIAASQVARAQDNRVSRYRPLIIVSDTQGSKPDLTARANWERNKRAGDSDRWQYGVSDLQDVTGTWWEPNRLVQVADQRIGLFDTLLIASVTLGITNTEAERAQLELVSPNAFDVFIPPTKGGKTW